MDSYSDPNDPAARRYIWQMLSLALAFAGSTYVISALYDSGAIAVPLAYALAVLPLAFLLGTFGAFWRFLRNVDEFVRSVHQRAVIAGLFGSYLIANVWGYLELYLPSPTLPAFWLGPIGWAIYGAVAVVLTRRAGLPL